MTVLFLCKKSKNFPKNYKNYLKDDGSLFIVVRKEQGAKSLIVDLQKLYNVKVLEKKKGFFRTMIDNFKMKDDDDE